MPKLPKISEIPKPPMPAWLANHENRAKGYSYVNIVIHVYQLYSFWFDLTDSGQYFLNALIYLAFVIAPVALGFFLLIGVHKRELQKMGIWWATEIFLFTLYVTTFIIGAYFITVKTVLNLILHGSLRIFGIKVIYDYMVTLNAEFGNSINKVVDSSQPVNTNPFEDVALDDPWSGEEKL